ncbi:MAG: hypothetical protein ACPGFA_03820 [Pikeienuella sp.]
MKVLIGTPTAGGIAKIQYSTSVLACANAVAEAGGTCELVTFDGAHLVIARNYIAHCALSDPAITHVLSLDSDMDVDIEVFRRLIAANVDLVAAVYTERGMDLQAFANDLAANRNPGRATARAARFTATVEEGELTVRNHLCKLKNTALGCSLIRRSVFERIIATGQVKPFICRKLRDMGLTGEMWDFFAESAAPQGGILSEDYSFCERAKAAGITLTGYVGPGVGHVGSFTYEGPFIERLKTGRVS